MRELNAEVVERGVEDSVTDVTTAFAGIPTLAPLIGRVAHLRHMGTLQTTFP